MKILHICTWDTDGGAAIAAVRHCEAMKHAGYESEMLVLLKHSGNLSVFEAISNKIELRVKRSYYGRRNSRQFEHENPYADWSYSVYGFDISKHPKVKNADVVVLHWINSNFLSIKGIGNLMKSHPNLVWYLHDMWPMTGGCHYALGCEKFKFGCKKCPMFNQRSGSNKDKDASYLQFREKINNWSCNGNIRILAPSQWLCDLAKKSLLFKNRECSVLRNPVPTRIFKPLDKTFARHALNLPLNQNLILFGAASATNAYKGWPYLADALKMLRSDATGCIVFGNNSNVTSSYDTTLSVYPVGRYQDPLSLALLYNAADAFVTPSVADNYPNVLIEAMACGTPSIGFKIGGIPEIINDGKSGILANSVSSESLCEAIQRYFKSDIDGMSHESVNQIQKTNSYEAMKAKYIEYFG